MPNENAKDGREAEGSVMHSLMLLRPVTHYAGRGRDRQLSHCNSERIASAYAYLLIDVNQAINYAETAQAQALIGLYVPLLPQFPPRSPAVAEPVPPFAPSSTLRPLAAPRRPTALRRTRRAACRRRSCARRESTAGRACPD